MSVIKNHSHRRLSRHWHLQLFGTALVWFLSAPLWADAELKIHNRSSYPMIFGFWENGTDCSKKRELPADFNIGTAEGQSLTVPSDTLLAAGIAIWDNGDKLPVACDYILSFKLTPGIKYSLEFDVHDRRCYGQMYQEVNGTFQLILPGEAGELTERVSIIGWDMGEPGCELQ